MKPFDRWRAVMEIRGLSGAEKAVLSCLAFHAGGDELEAWPALQTIADETGFERSAVRRAIRGLVRKGYVMFAEQSPGRNANRYRINLAEPWRTATVAESNGCGEPHQPLRRAAPTVAESHPNNKRTLKERRDVQNDFIEAWFIEVWREFPKKQDKKEALTVWRKLNPDSELIATILDAIRRAKLTRDWRKDGGQYVPLLSTWLRRRRWEDEVDDPRSNVLALGPVAPPPT